MSVTFDSSDTKIVEVEGPSDPISKKPMPLKLFIEMLKHRQHWIDIGLIPDVPLPPEAYPPDYPREKPPDAGQSPPKT